MSNEKELTNERRAGEKKISTDEKRPVGMKFCHRCVSSILFVGDMVDAIAMLMEVNKSKFGSFKWIHGGSEGLNR